MGIMDMFQSGKGMDDYVREARENSDAVIVDVRSAEEFSKGHVKGARNVPLDNLAVIKDIVKNPDTPLYLHCLSGGRSAKAVAALKNMGYTNVVNMGGINSYKGALEKGGGGAGGGGGAR